MDNTPNTPKIGTGFTNLQNIMSANQGNQLGQAVGQGIANVAKTANQDLSNSQKDFETGLGQEQNKLIDTQNQTGQIFNNLSSNPSAITQEQAKYFQGVPGLQYSGPNGLNNQEKLMGEAQNASQLGQLTQSSGGKQQLINQFGTNKKLGYSQGARDLDTTLLGQQGNQQIQQARQQTTGLQGQVQNQATAAQNQAQAQQQALKDFQQGVQNQYQQVKSGNQQAINQAVKEQQGHIGQKNEYLTDAKNNIGAIAQGGDAQKQLALGRLQNAGYSQDQINQVSTLLDNAGGDPNTLAVIANSLSINGPTSADAQNSTTAQQKAQANALAMLGGSSPIYNDMSGPVNVAGQIKYDANQLNDLRSALHGDLENKYGAGVSDPRNAIASWDIHIPGGHPDQTSYNDIMARIDLAQNQTAGGGTPQWAPYFQGLRDQANAQYAALSQVEGNKREAEINKILAGYG